MKSDRPKHGVKTLTYWIIVSIIYLWPTLLSSQGITGAWKGILETGVQNLTLIFHISDCGLNCHQGYMESPDQGAMHIAISDINLIDSICLIKIDIIGAEYIGLFDGSVSIIGTFKQFEFSSPLVLYRIYEFENSLDDSLNEETNLSHDISIWNKNDSTQIAGTLELPNDGSTNYPAVILISGSGSHNRDYSVFGHDIFTYLADKFLNKGIAVLRYDDRGVGESSGDLNQATILELASDIKAAVMLLKSRIEIDSTRIGLVGHSAGGLVSILLASSLQNDINQIVLLATPCLPGDLVLLEQQQAILMAIGINKDTVSLHRRVYREIFDIVIEKDGLELPKEIEQYLIDNRNILPSTIYSSEFPFDNLIALMKDQFTNPWLKDFLSFDPREYLSRVKCPILALIGDKDLQVDSKINLAEMKIILEQSNDVNHRLMEMKGLNHLFQKTKTGHIDEYSKIDYVFTSQVINEMTDWVLKN